MSDPIPFKPKLVAASLGKYDGDTKPVTAPREGSPEALLIDWLKNVTSYTDIVICAYDTDGNILVDQSTMTHSERHLMLAQATSMNLFEEDTA